MKFNFKKEKLKPFATIAIIGSMAITAFLSVVPDRAKADEMDGTPMYDVEMIHTISRNDGGGMYGTHTYPSYSENGVQYYRTGDIIEVDFSLPEGHGSTAFQDVLEFDNTKVELLSSYREIVAPMAPGYRDKDWDVWVSKYNQQVNQFLLIGSASDYHYGSEWKGGTLGKAYFRVLPGVESDEGTPITFNFLRFQTCSYHNGKLVYTHKGYDPERDAETAYYLAEPMTVVSKKPSEKETEQAPVLELTESKKTIYEGDLFNPQDYIAKASSSEDPTVGKDSVVISEGTGEKGKHQPAAGKYTFKYTVTSSSGLTTEKTFDLEVKKRTYTVESVNVGSKEIKLPKGSTEENLVKILEALKKEDFDVTVVGNDGNKFIVPGIVLKGETESYQVNQDGVLSAQTFNVNFELALPLISYNTKGERVVVPYNGNANFVSNVGDGTTKAKVKVEVLGGDKPSTDGNTSTTEKDNGDVLGSSIEVSGKDVETGDSTNVDLWILFALLSFGVISYKVLERN